MGHKPRKLDHLKWVARFQCSVDDKSLYPLSGIRETHELHGAAPPEHGEARKDRQAGLCGLKRRFVRESMA